MHRGINLPVKDESEDEDKVEENAKAEIILNPEKRGFLEPSLRLEKDLSLRLPHFQEILIQRS